MKSSVRRCDWCGQPLDMTRGPGRPRRFCKPSHRQRSYEARQEAQRRGIAPGEVLLTERAWGTLRDALYRLETAADDIAQDVIAGRRTKAAYVEALAHLSAAVRELQEVSVEPTAIGESGE